MVGAKETYFGNLVPSMDYSCLAVNDAMTKAYNSEEYIQCATIRIGQPFDKNELNQCLEKLIMNRAIKYCGGYGKEAKFREA